uniref:Uncharacterized protein n=1 Tax=Solanum tuberosum TaxID=4113 RepID=M1DA34_SOLTU
MKTKEQDENITRQLGAKKLKKLKEEKLVLAKATRQVTEWTLSSLKVPVSQPMDKTNLARRLVIRQCAKEIGDADLVRLIFQNEVLKWHTKKARRGAFGVSSIGSAILTHFAESYKIILLKKAR